jgi:hypothetical protein
MWQHLSIFTASGHFKKGAELIALLVLICRPRLALISQTNWQLTSEGLTGIHSKIHRTNEAKMFIFSHSHVLRSFMAKVL